MRRSLLGQTGRDHRATPNFGRNIDAQLSPPYARAWRSTPLDATTGRQLSLAAESTAMTISR